MKRMKELQAESDRSTTLRRKPIHKKSKAERRHRSIVVGVEQQCVDAVCEDEQRVRGHFFKVKATNEWTGRN